MDEVSGIVDQLPLQLCVLGTNLVKDTQFLNICRQFQVRFFFCDETKHSHLIANVQVPVVTSENGEGLNGREGGVRTIFVHENFSGR